MVMEYLKKGLEIGIHAADLDEKKAKKLASELVAAGKLTVKEAEIFMGDVKAAARESEKRLRKTLSSRFDSKIDSYLKSKGYSTKSDTAKLKRRIKDLEAKLKKKR
jgi:polyhydroxyalkanoate synthesis regulator phasin